ncbi:hypothetical protein EW146_g7590 [Bondarzewia mesenterica]|uniref:Cytochrome c oxidase assembly protein COX16, mitochondrial n=1 Tax=Bondarzewia mesenterica TaxID=1095465 RepID=A0A4S4LM53_9AGAM|nr:hypothetical protein EW146_g7590 [Bondarzewia mesenterica]
MPVFPSNSLNSSPLARTIRRNPLLFGVPFVCLIVGASFGLQAFTQTRYELHNQKVTQMSKEQELGLNKDRKKFDIREEYFVSRLVRPLLSLLSNELGIQKLSATNDNQWEPKRIARPKGLPEWGVPPEEPTPRPSSTD